MQVNVLTIRSNGLYYDGVAAVREEDLIPTLLQFVDECKIENVDPDSDYEQLMTDIEENIQGRGFEIDVDVMDVIEIGRAHV